jgi:hypothetical protein
VPIKPADFYAVAEALKFGRIVAPGEPCDRTSIGRAYYASYLALRAAVRSAYGTSDDIEHSDLRRCLAGATDADVADLGMRLKTLWVERRKADYEPSVAIAPHAVALSLANAKVIVQKAASIVPKIPAGIPTKS